MTYPEYILYRSLNIVLTNLGVCISVMSIGFTAGPETSNNGSETAAYKRPGLLHFGGLFGGICRLVTDTSFHSCPSFAGILFGVFQRKKLFTFKLSHY